MILGGDIVSFSCSTLWLVFNIEFGEHYKVLAGVGINITPVLATDSTYYKGY